jgi:hypothetical protein
VTPFEGGFRSHSGRHTKNLSLEGDLSSLPFLSFLQHNPVWYQLVATIYDGEAEEIFCIHSPLLPTDLNQ